MKKLDSEKWSGVVLGVNDGLIELTGALVGLSFALQNHSIVALSGLITGISASLSMAASSYMHARQEIDTDPKIVSIFTGISYLVVVFILVTPYFLLNHVFSALAWMLGLAFLIIVFISWRTAKWRKHSFWKEFGITLALSLGVAFVTFIIGLTVKRFVPLDL